MATCAPAPASASAIARPMLRLPPETSAILPAMPQASAGSAAMLASRKRVASLAYSSRDHPARWNSSREGRDDHVLHEPRGAVVHVAVRVVLDDLERSVSRVPAARAEGCDELASA